MPDNKKHVALILAQLGPKSGKESEGMPPSMGEHDSDEMLEEGAEKDDELRAIAGELISAVKHGDTDAAVEALRAAFLCLDAQPHVEGKHVEETEEEGYEEPGESEESFSHEVGEKYGGGEKYAQGGKAYAYGGMARKSYASGGRALARSILSQMRPSKSK